MFIGGHLWPNGTEADTQNSISASTYSVTAIIMGFLMVPWKRGMERPAPLFACIK